MKIKIEYETPRDRFASPADKEEIIKTVQLLESSDILIKGVKDIRKAFSLPEKGIPEGKTPVETSQNIWSTLSEERFGELYDVSCKLRKKLGLPKIWDLGINTLILHNFLAIPYEESLWIEEGTDKNGDPTVVLTLNRQVNKTELKKLVELNWEQIKSYSSKLPVSPTHKVINVDVVKDILKLKEQKKTYSEIADFIQNTSGIRYEEIDLRIIISNWKKRLRKYKLIPKTS